MIPQDLLKFFQERDVAAIHFRTGFPPMLRRQERVTLLSGLKPLSAERMRGLGLQLMTKAQRTAFADREEVEFSTSLEGMPPFQVRMFSHKGQPALTIRPLSPGPQHPSLAAPPQKRHWVRLTRVCNDQCSFCLDKDAQNGTTISMDDVLADLRAGREKGIERVVLSGGEPTIHPDFVEIVRQTKKMGYAHIQTVTNGRRMCYEDFLLDCVRAGLAEVTFSLHGHTPELHDGLTRSPGSFAQGLLALRRALKFPGLIVSVDIVINKQNVRHLRESLDFFIRQGVREFDLLQVIPFGAAWYNQEELFYDIAAELPHLHRALDLSKRGDVVIWTNRLPAQYLEGYEDLIQPPSKLHDEVRGRGLMFENFLRLGVKPTCWGRCPHCFLQNLCADVADFNSRGSLKGHPVPECLKDHPEMLTSPEREGEPSLRLAPEVGMKELVDFYIPHRYFVKGSACRRCRFDARCAGAPIEHVRRYGFPKPKPGMQNNA